MKYFATCTLAFAGLFLANLPVTAQTVNQATWMIGGSAGFSSTKINNTDGATTILDLSPTLGLFIIDDLAAGLAQSCCKGC